jgi:hypothetical protein
MMYTKLLKNLTFFCAVKEICSICTHNTEKCGMILKTLKVRGENHMTIMVASDIHGSAKYCRELLSAREREGAPRLLLLGDILYHGPRNDLPDEYAPKQVIALLNDIREDLLCVRGNCDTEVDQMVLDFPILADYAAIYLGGRVFYATHGHVYNAVTPPPLGKGDCILCGHTHIPAWDAMENGGFCLNPGSVSIPKGGSARGYMLVTEHDAVWKTLSGDVVHTLEL